MSPAAPSYAAYYPDLITESALIEKPFHVEIEATNLCNTQCLHCPHSAISRPMGKMAIPVFQNILAQVIEFKPRFGIEFAGMGEPLLNPDIYQFIALAAPHAAYTAVTTNGAALTPANLDKLIEAGLSQLTISFNGSSPELYRTMMGGLSFERGANHLRLAVEKSQGTPLEVAANVSVTRQTQPYLPEIRQYLEENGIRHIFFSKCHNRGGFLKDGTVCDTPLPPTDRYRCDIFKNTFFIAWTGQVLACCHDLSGVSEIGDLRKEKIQELLERKEQITQKGVRFPICKECNDLYRFMNDSTPGNETIAEWVYALYTQPTAQVTNSEGTNTISAPTSTPLMQWITQVYLGENQGELLSQRLVNILEEQTQKNDAHTRYLQNQIDEIYNSRAWQLISQIQKLRLALIPKGSQRERIFHKILGSRGK